jgi:hypothetical protein
MKKLTDNQVNEIDKMLKRMKKKSLLWYLSNTYSGGPSIIMERETYIEYVQQLKNKSTYFKIANKFQKIIEESFEVGLIRITKKGSPNCIYFPIVESAMMEKIIDVIDIDDQSPVITQASITVDSIIKFALDHENISQVEGTPGLYRIN